MKIVQHGSLKTSRKQFDPESGWLKLSLRVPQEEWKPQCSLEEWDPNSRMFMEVRLHLQIESQCLLQPMLPNWAFEALWYTNTACLLCCFLGTLS